MEKEGTEKAPLKLGFLSYKEFDNGKRYRGAVLVTDAKGLPLEFRATSPVQPNTLQKILHGKKLLPHILVKLMGSPLLKAIKEKPSCILVNNRDFLALRRKIDLPIICLRPQGHLSPSIGENIESFLVESEILPVVVEGNKDFIEEVRDWREKLRSISQEMDLLEPFDRIGKALEEVEKRKILEEDA